MLVFLAVDLAGKQISVVLAIQTATYRHGLEM